MASFQEYNGIIIPLSCRNLLGNGWYATVANSTVTLHNLEQGKRYLAQIFASRSGFTTQPATAPDNVATIRLDGSGWEYGGSLIGIFTTSAAMKEFLPTDLGIVSSAFAEVGASAEELRKLVRWVRACAHAAPRNLRARGRPPRRSIASSRQGEACSLFYGQPSGNLRSVVPGISPVFDP